MLVVLMTLVLGVTAFAEDNGSGDGPILDPGDGRNITVGINKDLVMPAATPTPNFTFHFDFEFIGMTQAFNLTPSPAHWPADSDDMVWISPVPSLTGAPGVDEIQISFDESMSGVVEGFPVDTKTVSGCNDATFTFTPEMFPTWGLYVFRVREQQNTNTLAEYPEYYQYLNYSDAEFEIRILVVPCDCEETACNGLRLDSLVTIKVYNDDGTPGGYKVDPTPGTYSEYGVPTDPSGLSFTNVYIRTDGTGGGGNGGDPYDPDYSTLIIRKEVTGNFGLTNQLFPFLVTIYDNPVVAAERDIEDGFWYNWVYRAYIFNTNGDNDVMVAGSPIFFTPGSAVEVNLRHGYELRFVNTPVGTRFVAYEEDSYGHLISITTNTNQFGMYAPNTTVWPGVTDVATGSAGTPVNNVTNGPALVVSTGTPYVDFENNLELPPQTGLHLQDLPFVLSILAIFAAGAGFVAFKVYKAKKENNFAL
ncbi:MAG: hypothetical protein FWE25_05845 [Lachnospiraceae bacterium]|nr:hypothetical protein [Lachnospiraceae bacterium]